MSSESESDNEIYDFMPSFSSVAQKGKDKFSYRFQLDNVEDDVQENDPEEITYKPTTRNPITRSGNNLHLNKNEPSPNKQAAKEDIINLDGFMECEIDEEKELNTSASNTLALSNQIGNRLENLLSKVRNISEQAPVRSRGRGRGRRGRTCKLTKNAIGMDTSNTPRITRSKRAALDSVVVIEDELPDIVNVEELNPTVTVNVLWNFFEKNSFNVKKYDTLGPIKKYFADKKKVDSESLCFMLKNKLVDLENNSYVSLHLDDKSELECFILPEVCSNEVQFNIDEEDMILLKIQFNAKRKNVFAIKCKRSDNVDIIYWQVCKETKVPVERIKLYFDGEFLKQGERISSIDFEDGDCIDLVFVE